MKILRPRDGDYRYVTKFIWFPKKFNGVIVWLETVTIRQIYFCERVLITGWCDVCLSDPKTGLPLQYGKNI